MRPTRKSVTTMFMGSALILMIAALGYAQPVGAAVTGQPLPDPGFLMLVTTGLLGLASVSPWSRM
jgi:hypothetical protein